MIVRCVSVGAPRELCSNGERRSDRALYFGPKSFSEIRDDEGYATQVPNASAKVLLFFDMAMGWSGLRAVCVPDCVQSAPGYRGYLGYPTCVFFLNLCYI